MTSKESFREFGQGPLLMPPVQPIDWWWGLVATLAIVGTLALTAKLDERADRLHTAAAVEQRVRSEMTQTVVAAYRQGKSDALEAVACGRGEVRP